MRILIAYGPHRLGKDKHGKPAYDTHILSTVQDVEAALREYGHEVERSALERDVSRFLARARKFKPHLVFNLCEHVGGDARLEKNAVAIFELARLRFTGNPCLALALCLEKPITKRILRAYRLQTPEFSVVAPGETIDEFPLPAIVKPSRTDGSLGITARSVVRSRPALERRVAYVHKTFKQPALVERFISGREFQVALLGNTTPRILAVAELSFRGLPKHIPRICAYAAKWQPTSHYYRHTNPVIPAHVSETLKRRLEKAALKAYRIFGLRGYARVDFRVSRGVPHLIEVNPNPDISPDAGMARAGANAGFSYAGLINRIAELGLE